MAQTNKQTIELRDYQKRGIDLIARAARDGHRRVILQASTGSGKTVMFSALARRFLNAPLSRGKRLVIAVHRIELLHQTVRALKNVSDIDAGVVIAGKSGVVRLHPGDVTTPYSSARVVVCMVETLYNRLKKNKAYLGDVGMLTIDEVHQGNFSKLYDYFPKAYIIGFSATPVSANKAQPLKNFFDTLVAPATINDLIAQGHLAQNVTYSIKNVDRSRLKIKRGEFDEREMSEVLCKSRHVQNVIKSYKKYADNEKAIVFNVTVNHSQIVTKAFQQAGYDARHLDGTTPGPERKALLKWFKHTPGAILSGVGVLTTGFDEPTVQCAIMNRATLSLPLWIQCCGRAARIHSPSGKRMFKILDLGGNAHFHLDFNYPHDWKHYFDNPEVARPGKGGVAPVKECRHCGAMIHLSAKICPVCKKDTTPEVSQKKYDAVAIELEIVTKGIDITQIHRSTVLRQHNPYRTLHIAKSKLVQAYARRYPATLPNTAMRTALNDRYQEIVRQWCRENKKRYNGWHRETTEKWLNEEIDRAFKAVIASAGAL